MTSQVSSCLKNKIGSLEKFNKKIDTILYLTAIRATQGRSFEDRVDILNRLGFSKEDIILITGKRKEDVNEYLNWKDVKGVIK